MASEGGDASRSGRCWTLGSMVGGYIPPKHLSKKGGAMQRLIFAMRFAGQATPAAADGAVLKTASAASSCSLVSTVGPNGLAGILNAVDGEVAILESEITLTGETSFQVVGSITFGRSHRLSFSTIAAAISAQAPIRRAGMGWRCGALRAAKGNSPGQAV